jgi:thiosulfate dehydrogenase (quinone) large subunit
MSDSCHSHKPKLELVFANLLLRLWVALRLVMAGLDKFRSGDGVNATFNMENYNYKMGLIAQATHERGFIPLPLCNLYAKPLGFLLLICGIWAAIGIFSRLGLLACGLIMLSLGVGLSTMGDDTEVVYVGIHILIIAAALATNHANKLSLDGLLFSKKNAPEKTSEAA